MLLFAIESGSVDLLSNYCCIFGEFRSNGTPTPTKRSKLPVCRSIANLKVREGKDLA
jgi:hypothetical protein